MRKKFNKVSRRAMTVTLAFASIISLSACTNVTNSYGKLEADEIYATAGNFTVSNGELWNEFKWDAAADMKAQFTNVVLDDEISKVTLVLKNSYSSLTEDDKKLFLDEDDENDTFTEDEYNALYTKYSDRIVDYVVQDIFDLVYSTDRYWDNIDLLSQNTINKSIAKYADEIFSAYKIDKIDGVSISDIVTNAVNGAQEGYLTIAKTLTKTYYPMLAKEICAEEEIGKKAWDAYDEDAESDTPIEDDSKIGYFANSDIISKFKSLYANQYDLDLLMIRFNSEDEMQNTFRAFGILPYDGKFYFITKDEGETYTNYCTKYDKITNPKDGSYNKINDSAVLEILVQMYNYIYSGYRHTLTTNYPFTGSETLESLYDITRQIIIADTTSTEDEDVRIAGLIDNLLAADSDYLHFTREELDDMFVSGMITELYDNLDLEDNRYTGTSKNYNDSSYIIFKLDEADDEYGLYDKDLTNDELITKVILAEDNEDIFNNVYTLLIHDTASESTISDYVNSRIENVEVKIFDEATLITYRKDNEYKKNGDKAPNENCIACIEYDGKTYHYNIKADNDDELSIKIPGTDEAYGAFDYMVLLDGPTTAIDLLSTKIIKTTKAYEDTAENSKNFESYIENIILSFTNGGLASYGYDSSIGVYDFMMLYFHSTNIDDIVNDFYRVQYASSKLLTDYSNIDLIEFLQKYASSYYDDFFSISGQNLLVYFDGDDDTEADKVVEWENKEVEFEGSTCTLQAVAKMFIYDIYNELNSSSDSHATRLSEITTEINDSARVQFDENPILVENQWAKYRKVGLNVKSEEFSVTNSTIDVDFQIKQRVLDYYKGYKNYDKTQTYTDTPDYQYFIGESTPTEYLQQYVGTRAEVAASDQIVKTENGFNLLLITGSQVHASAKFSEDDHSSKVLEDIVLRYNDKYVTIDNIYNEDDKLSVNQILLYVLQNTIEGTATIIPTELNDAISALLSPVYSRYTDSETQRVIILYFIEQKTGAKIISDTNIFANAQNNEQFATTMAVNHRVADNYNGIYADPTDTVNSFKNWWSDLETSVSKFLLKEGENND